MNPPTYPQLGERRGLHCPKCQGRLDSKVAQSYPSPAGQFRRRICPDCLADVETAERVVGLVPEVLDISGLDRDQVRVLTQMLATFRRENGRVIEMRRARVPAAPLALPEPT
jgi:transcriptional regulator NrdR family protein